MVHVAGLIAIGELACDGCGKVMKHCERYGYICEEGQPAQRLCEDCSRERGYLRRAVDEKGNEIETFLEGADTL